MPDVEPQQYPTVIRDMIKHENDVTNHRIMWLLIGEGLIANAYVNAATTSRAEAQVLPPLGVLVALSTFAILYKSYHARGYLQFLGVQAKLGKLQDVHLPLMGWPPERIGGWRTKTWAHSWLGKWSDLIEPFFFLPALLTFSWLFVFLHQLLGGLGETSIVVLTLALTCLSLFLFCWVFVRMQAADETLSLES